MEGSGTAQSIGSESSSVLDLSWTYDISDALQHEHCKDTCADSFPSIFSSTSSGQVEEDADSSTLKCKETVADDDSQFRKTMDSFYELNCQDKCNQKEVTVSQQLSAKISDLRVKNHLYALRSFQMARVILNRDGTNVLRNPSKDTPFSSQNDEQLIVNKLHIPGISEDVANFIIHNNKT
ncbi:Hypothetical predicted protein [Pelobates cultripes]|nr:Hypothetical predicted protein [Pelobates cultripes]